MKILQKIFLSMGSALIMVMLFAIAIAAATFIENDYGPVAARYLIYEAKWFEVLILLLGVNLVANIVRYQLWKQGKRLILIFHAALILIYLGAALTRYAGYEGLMHIREGENSGFILSDDASLTITVRSGEEETTVKRPFAASPILPNNVSQHFTINGVDVDVEVTDAVQGAAKTLVDDDYGSAMLSLAVYRHGGRQDVILREQESIDLPTLTIAFETEAGIGGNRIRIRREGENLLIRASRSITSLSMEDQERRILRAGEETVLAPKTTYRIGDIRLVLKTFKEKARIQAVPNQGDPMAEIEDALLINVTSGGIVRQASVFGGSGIQGEPVQVNLENVEVELAYGSSAIQLPFSLTLVDFEVGRYPGSMKPSSYSSDVIIMDEEKGLKEPFLIYMNHILRHRGYRFFQSDSDPDEMGTVLSVSHDPGTPVAYLGFFLMMAALVINLFRKESRFRKLGKKLAETPAFWILFLMTAWLSSLNAQNPAVRIKGLTQEIDRDHLKEFGQIVVQDGSGRIKPVSSLAHEFAYDLTGSPHFPGAHPLKAVFSMWMNPDAWRGIPLFRIKHPGIREGLQLDRTRKKVAVNELYLRSSGQYRLTHAVREAQGKPPGRRSLYDREILALDEKVKAFGSIATGTQFRIFPIPEHPAQRWTHAEETRFKRSYEDSLMVADLMSGYREAVQAGNWIEADMALLAIRTYQFTYGENIIPRSQALSTEVAYNNLHIFERLAPVSFILGLAILALTILPVFIKKADFKLYLKILFFLLLAVFILQTAGFVMRWIASRHAPWSNKYESMIYIAWATLLAGLLFSRRSVLALGSAALWNGVILMVAHMAWMNPHITNLPPVLKSYWLVIHVSVITSSYGFLGLGAVVSSVLLILFIFKEKHHQARIEPLIQRSTWTNERILTVGLILIAVGNIFGAIWANESWGRYWGWDPKETWTLIVILVYTAVLHLRLIPAMRRAYLLHVMSLLAFGSVIMTYFGVNFYLSGLHSYAQGDPLPVPWFVYADIIALGIIIILGIKNYRLSYEEKS